MKKNLFKVLGIQAREDCISNAIAYAINTSQSFMREFLRLICDKDCTEYIAIKAYTRVSTGSSGIPDIVLILESQSAADIVVFENKIKAEEGYEQTIRYSAPEAVNALINRLIPGKKPGHSSFVFLTLFPDQYPAAQQYSVHRHSELKQVLARITTWENELAQQLINDWVDLLEQFYERENIEPSDIFYERLTDDSGLDAGFLYFRQALSLLDVPRPLRVQDLFRSSEQGRHYYGGKISKESWHPSEMKQTQGAWEIDPQTNFNIHLEPQYNVLNGVFNCSLHYEINPYEPEKWVKDNIPSGQYNAYLKRRTSFASKLPTQNLPGWNFGGGSNQIAKISFDFSKSTYAEVKSILEQEIATIHQAIDRVLKEI